MKKNYLLLLLLILLVPLTALAVNTGIRLFVAKRFEFTDCAAAGSAAQTVTQNTYLMRIITEDIWICYAATCAANGEKFQSGTVMMLQIPAGGQVVSCRSAGSTGDLVLTGAAQ